MSTLLEFLLIGLGVGAAYAFLALPMSLVHSTTGVLDLGIGGYAVVAGLFAATVGGTLQAVGVAVLAGLAAGLLSGIVFVALQVRRHSDHLTAVLATLGVLFAAGSFAQLRFGTSPYFRPLNWPMLRLGDIPLRPQTLVNLALALALLGLLLFVLYRTSLGRAMRASAVSAPDAALVGIGVRKLQLGVFALGGVLSALGGVLLVTTSGLQYVSSMNLSIMAIGAVIVFGMRGPVTAVAGGLALGMVQGLGYGYAPNTISPIIPLLFIFGVLASGRFDFDVAGGRP